MNAGAQDLVVEEVLPHAPETWPDRAPKGRNETGVWFRRHDEYDKR